MTECFVRVKVGDNEFEARGEMDFVEKKLEEFKDQLFLSPNAPRSGSPRARIGGKRGSSEKTESTKTTIKVGSDIELTPQQIDSLISKFGMLGKLNAQYTVFHIANFLKEELKMDSFTLEDLDVCFRRLKFSKVITVPPQIDIAQTVNNLVAKSVGKEWLKKNEDGTISISNYGLHQLAQIENGANKGADDGSNS